MKAARTILAVIFAISLLGVFYSGPKSWNWAWNGPAAQSAGWWLLLTVSLVFFCSSLTISAFTFSKVAVGANGQMTINNGDFLIKFLKKLGFIEPCCESLDICQIFWITVLMTVVTPTCLALALLVMWLYIQALITNPIIILYVTAIAAITVAAFVHTVLLGRWPRLEQWADGHLKQFLTCLAGFFLMAWLMGCIIYKGSLVTGLIAMLTDLAVFLTIIAFLAAALGLVVGAIWLIGKIVEKIQARWPRQPREYREPRPTPAVVVVITSGIKGFIERTCARITIV